MAVMRSTRLPGYKRAHMGFGYMPEDRRLVPEMTAEQNILVPVWSTGIKDFQIVWGGFIKLFQSVKKFRETPATSSQEVSKNW